MYHSIGIQTSQTLGGGDLVWQKLEAVKQKQDEELLELQQEWEKLRNKRMQYERMMKVELKCDEMKALLEDAGYSKSEILERVDMFRVMLFAKENMPDVFVPEKNEFIQQIAHEGHKKVESAKERSSVIKEAFGLLDFEEGGNLVEDDRKDQEEVELSPPFIVPRRHVAPQKSTKEEEVDDYPLHTKRKYRSRHESQSSESNIGEQKNRMVDMQYQSGEEKKKKKKKKTRQHRPSASVVESSKKLPEKKEKKKKQKVQERDDLHGTSVSKTNQTNQANKKDGTASEEVVIQIAPKERLDSNTQSSHQRIITLDNQLPQRSFLLLSPNHNGSARFITTEGSTTGSEQENGPFSRSRSPSRPRSGSQSRSASHHSYEKEAHSKPEIQRDTHSLPKKLPQKKEVNSLPTHRSRSASRSQSRSLSKNRHRSSRSRSRSYSHDAYTRESQGKKVEEIDSTPSVIPQKREKEHFSRSRSKSKSRSRHWTRSYSRSMSRSRSKSRSRSYSKSRSRSRSRSSRSTSYTSYGRSSRTSSSRSSYSRSSRSYSYSRSRSGSWSSSSSYHHSSRSRSSSVTKNKSMTAASTTTDLVASQPSMKPTDIRRRSGSPCHLDKRRITSARKRPIPYNRPPPLSSDTYTSSSSSWSSRSNTPTSRFRGFSRSPSITPRQKRSQLPLSTGRYQPFVQSKQPGLYTLQSVPPQLSPCKV